jgi:hypothetical protein
MAPLVIALIVWGVIFVAAYLMKDVTGPEYVQVRQV